MVGQLPRHRARRGLIQVSRHAHVEVQGRRRDALRSTDGQRWSHDTGSLEDGIDRACAQAARPRCSPARAQPDRGLDLGRRLGARSVPQRLRSSRS
jgi:hypothetical protein